MKFVLNNTDYVESTESIKFPKTVVGEESFTEITIVNPFATPIHVEAIPEDPDVYIESCPSYISGNQEAKVILKYKPKLDRKETLNGKIVRFEVAV